jgi:ChpA-C
MRAWAHRTAKTVMLTAAVTVAGSGLPGVGLPGAAFAASAGAGGSTSGLGSVLGGHQASAPINAPVDVCGSAVAVLGLGPDGCQGGASVASPSAGSAGGSMSPATSGNGSAGGNQISVPVSVPVGVCGNAVGNAVAGCRGGAPVSGAHNGTGSATSGSGSVGGGNKAVVPVSIPADVCGNAAAVLSDSLAGCEGTASVRRERLPSRGRAGGREFNGAGTQRGAGGARAGSLPSGLGGLPVASALSGLPQPASSSLTDLAGPAAASAPVAGGTADGQPIPANALAADSPSGMGSVSFYFLAIGALLAGAVALKMAGRRIRGHRIRGHKA